MMLYKNLAKDLNHDPNKVFVLSEGQSIILEDHVVKEGPKFETKNIYVDGLGIGDVGTVVLRDRQVMSEDGIFLPRHLRDNSQVGDEYFPRASSIKKNRKISAATPETRLSCLKDVMG
jgi:mRNA degradation ribonuclease J1/J2